MEHKLYVIEGLDGSGKATQATLLTDYQIWMSSPWAQQQKQVHSEQLRIQEIQSTFLVVHQVVQLQQLQQMNALRHLVQIQVVL